GEKYPAPAVTWRTCEVTDELGPYERWRRRAGRDGARVGLAAIAEIKEEADRHDSYAEQRGAKDQVCPGRAVERAPPRGSITWGTEPRERKGESSHRRGDRQNDQQGSR